MIIITIIIITPSASDYLATGRAAGAGILSHISWPGRKLERAPSRCLRECVFFFTETWGLSVEVRKRGEDGPGFRQTRHRGDSNLRSCLPELSATDTAGPFFHRQTNGIRPRNGATLVSLLGLAAFYQYLRSAHGREANLPLSKSAVFQGNQRLPPPPEKRAHGDSSSPNAGRVPHKSSLSGGAGGFGFTACLPDR